MKRRTRDYKHGQAMYKAIASDRPIDKDNEHHHPADDDCEQACPLGPQSLPPPGGTGDLCGEARCGTRAAPRRLTQQRAAPVGKPTKARGWQSRVLPLKSTNMKTTPSAINPNENSTRENDREDERHQPK